ncbi:cytochrome-c peroxidase [Pseudoalteromonas luteoviolacea]|nr:cytochrome c peroxidase [Pseudoalteromonas luteoviolacea]
MFESYYRPLIRQLMLVALFITPTYVSAVMTIKSSSPERLIAKVHSATEVGLSWQAPAGVEDITGYRVFRDGKRIGRTKVTFFVDTNAQPDTEYTYYVTAFTRGKNRVSSLPSNSSIIKTLNTGENDGMRNGSVIRVGIARLVDHCGTNDLSEISDEALDGCLDKLIEHYTLREGLKDMQAYVARYRRQEDAKLIELGKRLFFSKALSQNYDTSCASCHHPAEGCGSDGLSLSIGVNAENPDLMGIGRSDGSVVPSVGRNAPQICNSALWVDSMFWDQRVRLREANRDSEVGTVSTADIQTPEIEVTRLMNTEVANTDPLRLLMAQAHFPITAPAEMGDPSGFDSPQAYREFIAQRLSEQWKPHFSAAFGDDQISFLRIARAMSAYQASFLFIDNPFFNYIEGQQDKLNHDEKRGALFFYTGAGCANCHDGVMFTPERTRGPLYPQIGAHGVADGNFKNQFRMPSLLNVGITAPYGDKGVFATLERVIEHYSDVTGSLERFYGDNETCALPQFQHLSSAQCEAVVGDAGSYVLALNAQNRAASDRSDEAIIRGFTPQQVSYLAAFLRALTDPKAHVGSHEINALIPERDGGPDGHQFDAVNKEGEAL